jgi:glycerophosphoryl diester phosphodiesterase
VVVLNHLAITRDVVKYAEERGIEVYSFTINSADEARKLIDYGVAGIISDEGDMLL